MAAGRTIISRQLNQLLPLSLLFNLCLINYAHEVSPLLSSAFDSLLFFGRARPSHLKQNLQNATAS